MSISIHAPRVGSDKNSAYAREAQEKFQSTLPVWGATLPFPVERFISIHAPRVGSDALWLWTPAWRTPDFNPRSPCGERLVVLLLYLLAVAISIHAPRVGSDQALRGDLRQRRDFNPRSPCGERLIAQALVVGRVNISIHAPRVGSDGILRECSVGVAVFQSTLPVWGATADIHK